MPNHIPYSQMSVSRCPKKAAATNGSEDIATFFFGGATPGEVLTLSVKFMLEAFFSKAK